MLIPASHPHSPFEQPYASTSSTAPLSTSPLPRIVIPDPSPPNEVEDLHTSSFPPRRADSEETDGGGTASSHTMLNTSQGTTGSAGTGRKVQWGGHVAIPVGDGSATSPTRNMASPGAQDELTRALQAHSAAHTTDDEVDNVDRTHYSGAEGTPSRAASSDGDPEERLEALKDGLDVFVDPGERDGLPSARRGKPEETSTKAAWGLVRGLTQAGHLGGGGMRRRKTGPGGFSSGQGLNREESKDSKEEADGERKEEERSGFSAFIDRIKEGNVQDLPTEAPAPATSIGGGGILSALIALQQQQNGPDSTTPSGATTPTSMGPSTRANSIAEGIDFSDDEEEEAERARFLAKLHEKRANKNRLHHLADGFTQGATGVGVGVGRGAGAVIGTAGRSAGAVIGTAGKGAGAAINFAGKATGFSSKPSSKVASGAQTPATGELGETKRKDNKGVFDRAVGGLKGVGNAVGLDFAERPEAARSGAGVFGGLITGTVRPLPSLPSLLVPS